MRRIGAAFTYLASAPLRRGMLAAAALFGFIAAIIEITDALPATVSGTTFGLVCLGFLSSLCVAAGTILDLRKRLRLIEDERPYWRRRYDRIYHAFYMDWCYASCDDDPRFWSAQLLGRRHLTSQAPNLENITIGISRTADTFPSYDEGIPKPEVSLVDAGRQGGRVEVGQPHLVKGTQLKFKIHFIPALRYGEEVDVTFRVMFPKHRFAYREDILARTTATQGSVRDYDGHVWTISYPMEHFRMSAFIPHSLKPKPKALGVSGLEADAERTLISNENMFKITEAHVDGTEGLRLSLDRVNPPLGTTYRIEWLLPTRPNDVPLFEPAKNTQARRRRAV